MVDPRDLQLASEFCKLVEVADLFEYLGLPRDCGLDEALAALADRRKHMQAMQANPKFKDSARSLIKNYAALQRVLAEPGAHLEQVRMELEADRLPMLAMAIDSILSDGIVTANEEAFVRQSALGLGISLETYERMLGEKAAARGVSLPTGAPRTGPPVWPGGQTLPTTPVNRTMSEIDGEPKLQGAAGHGWWDATFTRMLLDVIPGGPGELVDIYCRTALSAVTVLPVRRQLTWLGVDRSSDRLEQAREQLPEAAAGRVTLAHGEPHALPIPDESVDFVLGIRALANLADTEPVFAEARRVLRPGGRLILAEPDGLAEAFCFDGHLVEYNAAFHRLCARVDHLMGASVSAMGRPGLALGPKLPARLANAGLRPISTAVHASHNLKERSFRSLARRLRGYAQAMARTVGIQAGPEMMAVEDAVNALELRFHTEARALGGNVLPLYLCVGVKD